MTRKFAMIVAGLSLALGSGAAAKTAPASAGVLTTIHQFIDSFDKGDIKAAQATHSSEAVIIDEVPPHVWRGPNAFQAWAADLDKAAKAAGDTDESVALGKPVRVQVDGDTAYAVVRATFRYTEKGRAMNEPAQMVFALHRQAGGWKITGWAWTGSTPKVAPATPATAPAKP